MTVTVRKLILKDCAVIAGSFARQGWDKPVEQYKGYFSDMENDLRHVLVAEENDGFAGYLTVLWASDYESFRRRSLPEITDLNVLIKFRRRGIATRLLEEAEFMIGQRSSAAGIRVGLTGDYGVAQRLYVRRGYIPDGLGLSYRNRPLLFGEEVTVDDDLTLGFIKQVRG